MGDIIGGVFGYLGAKEAASAQKEAANTAAQAALTGFNWLTGPGFQYAKPYLETGTAALPNISGANNSIAQLLGVQPAGEGSANAFNNYLNSTGYKFQLGEGINAINSSASAKGLLQSGGTAKALSQYGQNLASTTFGNYLNQLTGLAGSSQNQAALGQTGLAQIGGAGSQGGAAASGALIQGGLAAANSKANMFNNIGGAVGGVMALPQMQNFFSGGGGGW